VFLHHRDPFPIGEALSMSHVEEWTRWAGTRQGQCATTTCGGADEVLSLSHVEGQTMWVRMRHHHCHCMWRNEAAEEEARASRHGGNNKDTHTHMHVRQQAGQGEQDGSVVVEMAQGEQACDSRMPVGKAPYMSTCPCDSAMSEKSIVCIVWTKIYFHDTLRQFDNCVCDL
jgi:hypothetical protein